ncbi:MAG: glycosyltransferase [Brumimicrobium sp.]
MSNTQKILVITYYWPPSGGAGVQRWLKMTKYLAKKGLEVHVLTVKPERASYFTIDESLKQDVHPNIVVHHSDSFEPLKLYSKIIGKSKVPTAGFSNIDQHKRKQKIINAIRSNLFIPDPRIGWKKYAIKKAKQIINEHDIHTIVTTSPPHSVQLIGLEVKKEFKEKINWIVDFRDPWTDIYYYQLLNNSRYSHNKNLQLERKVLKEADSIITAGEGFKQSFLSKTNAISSDKFTIITNAYDEDDFPDAVQKIETSKDKFIVSYVGTMSRKYQPDVFFKALSNLIKNENKNFPVEFHFTGIVEPSVREMIAENIGNRVIYTPPVSHEKAIKAMRKSHVLLLATQGEEGTIPGKTFEYLASFRRIICLGKGDSSELISHCQAGESFDRNQLEAIENYIKKSYEEAFKGIEFSPDKDSIQKLSWRYNSDKILKLIK